MCTEAPGFRPGSGLCAIFIYPCQSPGVRLQEEVILGRMRDGPVHHRARAHVPAPARVGVPGVRHEEPRHVALGHHHDGDARVVAVAVAHIRI